jgi:D-serine deaminase-like pyridoxal phosphate-dependent protein
MITSEIVGRAKIERLMSLAGRADIVVAVDDEANVRDLSDAAVARGVEPGVVVEVNVGQDRCGTLPGERTAAVAKAVDLAPGLRFEGLMGYEGHLMAVRDGSERKSAAEECMGRLFAAADAVEAAGLPIKVLTAAGTGTYNITGVMERITDIQPGSYIFMDGDYLEVMDDFRPALTVLATVVSRPTSDRAVLDTGRKSVSVDRGDPRVLGVPGAEVMGLSEEHTIVTLTEGGAGPAIGDKVAVLPMHGDTTIAMHSHYYLVREGRLENVIEIAGRGCFR